MYDIDDEVKVQGRLDSDVIIIIFSSVVELITHFYCYMY